MDRILPTPRMRIGINGYVSSLTKTHLVFAHSFMSCICMIDQAKRRCRSRGYLGTVRTTSEFYHLIVRGNADIVVYDIVAKVLADLQASTSSLGTGLPPPISMVRFSFPSFSPFLPPLLTTSIFSLHTDWERLGNPNWNFANYLPRVNRVECLTDPRPEVAERNYIDTKEWKVGRNGPLQISFPRNISEGESRVMDVCCPFFMIGRVEEVGVDDLWVG